MNEADDPRRAPLTRAGKRYILRDHLGSTWANVSETFAEGATKGQG